jgi:hypothetical protein
VTLFHARCKNSAVPADTVKLCVGSGFFGAKRVGRICENCLFRLGAIWTQTLSRVWPVCVQTNSSFDLGTELHSRYRECALRKQYNQY